MPGSTKERSGSGPCVHRLSVRSDVSDVFNGGGRYEPLSVATVAGSPEILTTLRLSNGGLQGFNKLKESRPSLARRLDAPGPRWGAA